jgi:hypothetical protein
MASVSLYKLGFLFFIVEIIYVRSSIDKCVRGSIVHETEVKVIAINKYFP